MTNKNAHPESQAQPSGLHLIVRALRHRNYRLFFFGQSISLIGTWMQQIAMSWMVYRLTGSELMLGLVSFAGNVPVIIFAPIAGILGDRWNRHRMLVIIQSLALIQAVILALLVLTDSIVMWEIIVLGVCLGLINAFDMPIRQAYLVEMIEQREDLSNAIALNSSMFNMARLIGPALAGVLIAAVGEGYCFLINGLSYIAVILALFAMKVAPSPTLPKPTPLLKGLVDGFRYSFGFPPIRSILLLLILVSVIGMPYMVLMPVIAKTILHGDSHTLGNLVSCSGVGALAGAIWLASRKSVRGLGLVIPIMAGVFGSGLVALSLSRDVRLSMLFMVVTGFGMIVQMAASNTVLQTIVDEDKRGRVMGLYTMSIRGVAPFGSLLGGALASVIGTPQTLLICGLICIAGGLFFARHLNSWRRHVRPIYVSKGIIPEVSQGIQSATEITKPGGD
jgi:MFS family permease